MADFDFFANLEIYDIVVCNKNKPTYLYILHMIPFRCLINKKNHGPVNEHQTENQRVKCVCMHLYGALDMVSYF